VPRARIRQDEPLAAWMPNPDSLLVNLTALAVEQVIGGCFQAAFQGCLATSAVPGLLPVLRLREEKQ
jgi:hypothetical protein